MGHAKIKFKVAQICGHTVSVQRIRATIALRRLNLAGRFSHCTGSELFRNLAKSLPRWSLKWMIAIAKLAKNKVIQLWYTRLHRWKALFWPSKDKVLTSKNDTLFWLFSCMLLVCCCSRYQNISVFVLLSKEEELRSWLNKMVFVSFKSGCRVL